MTNKTMIAGAGIGGAVHVARWVASKAGKPIELIKANWNNPQFWTSAGMTTAISAAMEGGDFPGGIPFKPSNGTGNGMGPLPDSVATRTWTPFIGGPTFTRYDGLGGTRIAVTRKNGTIKVYRPYHPVVIPKRWNTSSMRRVDRSMKRLQKVAIGIVKMTGGDASASKRRAGPGPMRTSRSSGTTIENIKN